MKAYKISDNLSSMFNVTILFESQEGRVRVQNYPFMSKKLLGKIRETERISIQVFMYIFIEFFIRLSLGLNFHVHESAVSAPKRENEHIRYYETTVVLH